MAREVEEGAWVKGQKAIEGQWVDVIAENLRVLLRAHPRVKLGDHLRDVYGTTLGSARDKHVNAAWHQLVASGEAAQKEPNVKYLERAWLSRPTSA